MTDFVDFGSDVSTFSGDPPDVDPTFSPLTGVRVMLEAIGRRLTTPLGTLPEDSEYGYDVTQLINADLGVADIFRHQALIAAQCAADERVLSATATIVVNPDFSLTITVSISLASGTFPLVLDVSSVGVALSSTALAA